MFHLDGVYQVRPGEGKRARFRKMMSRIEELVQQDPESFDMNSLALPPHLANNACLRMKLQDRVRRIIDSTLAEQNQSLTVQSSSAP
mmetsp:Transcript_75859/g.142986  ORF Transcript_75859/g.142986 Transcript_75859/m.142986 type:complete len:87 (-) Transcript_75859:7-267(-)